MGSYENGLQERFTGSYGNSLREATGTVSGNGVREWSTGSSRHAEWITLRDVYALWPGQCWVTHLVLLYDSRY